MGYIWSMNRIDRLFGILTLLQSKKFVSAEKISERFDISIRTVYRDVKALTETGIPVSFEAGRGYFLVPGYFLPPVSFSSEEANALLLMETMITGLADLSIQKHYSTALNKIKSVLRSTEKEKLELLHNNTRFHFPEGMLNQYAHLSVLQEAIAMRQQLRLHYQRKDDTASERMVESIGLVFYAFSWHLIAWCHARGEYRDFRVSRIQKIFTTGIAFEKKDHISLNDYIQALPVEYR